MSELHHGYPTEGVALSEVESVGLFLNRLPEMISRARRARKNAASYRVKVGVSAFGVNPYTGETFIRTRSNIKTRQVKETRCGEPRAEQALRKAGALRTVAEVVIGPSDPETIFSISDVVTNTLHPCWRCRAELIGLDTMSEDTLIVSGGGGIQGEAASTNVFQVHTLGQIINLYRNPINIEDNQDTPISNVRLSAVPAVYDNLINSIQRDESPALTAIRALHLLNN